MNAQTPIPIPPGREAIAAAIETLIAILDAMTPDSDFKPDADQWEGEDERDQSWCERIVQTLPHTGEQHEDAEDCDPAGGDICDAPHDGDMDVPQHRSMIDQFAPCFRQSRIIRTSAWAEAPLSANEGK
jgi:hypothetical protein